MFGLKGSLAIPYMYIYVYIYNILYIYVYIFECVAEGFPFNLGVLGVGSRSNLGNCSHRCRQNSTYGGRKLQNVSI